jgi:glutamyl-tRNA synthetase
MGSEIVTRFAPSPTGHLHIGGARTALFCWALAQGGGTYLLRIEDTDQTRSSEESTRGILEDLAWLGIAWDEGPVVADFGGDPRGVGPFHQSERRSGYDEKVVSLIERDLAYPAFETAEELDVLRQAAQREKRGFRYRRPAGWDRDAALAQMKSEPHVVRFRMPTEAIVVRDEVLGAVEFGEEHLDDFIIRKRDGFPTYHLAVVVDDEEMGITHVLRGQEHLNNTPRHVALQQALGFATPSYLHLPLIFNSDGSKMSKRDKDKLARSAVKTLVKESGDSALEPFRAVVGEGLAAWLKDKRSQLPTEDLSAIAGALELELPCIEVEDFRQAGYLPDVICNYLALLGWNPGEKDVDGRDLERFDRAYLAERFSAARIGRSNARFDIEKLLAFNQDSMAELDGDEFFALWATWCSRYAPEALTRDEGWRRAYAAMIQSRCRTLADPTEPGGPGAFAWQADDEYAFDTKAVAKFVHKGDPSGHILLAAARAKLEGLAGFEAEPIETAIRELSEAREVGMGKIAQPLRVAVTGSSASPPLGDTLAILGRDAVLARIDRCLRECAP